MVFVVEQLKNWLKLAAPWVGAAAFIDSFSLLNAIESRRVHCSDIEGFVCVHVRRNPADWRDGRMDNMKDLSMYFYLFLLTRSGGK